ncbi:MAG: hypothetical protein EWV40_05650 [Microcystis flos-aquae Mf_WU_F_19750830_S460]|uniref:Programmed cell death toxin YdcE n=1 Tax=Microcystis flos-aquae Mf_WU_F_19750830_S460 TaxID=2486237 RepID=A0A552LXR7_9CHRO|nr:MAG: hypothetical protein EWV40_05650 [Microcystis flos-aquae Mf_WU_F_19750830_S460]
MQEVYYYSVFQSAEVQKLWVLGKRQEAKVKREEKYVYLTSLGNAILLTLTTIFDFYQRSSQLPIIHPVIFRVHCEQSGIIQSFHRR